MNLWYVREKKVYSANFKEFWQVSTKELPI